MIAKDLEAEILRLHRAEGWSVGTIAAQLHLHHSVVRRVIAQKEDTAPKQRKRRARMVDPYLPFIQDLLQRHPRLSASVIYRMCRERGFAGSERYLRKVVVEIRPRPAAEAYFRLRTLPGEQGQVDWGEFGTISVGKAVRRLYAFVLVLSYSRWMYLRFFLKMHTCNFLCGHQEAFAAARGVPRIILYDNLKSCVLERRDQAIRFNPLMLDFAGHYSFEARPVSVARGNEKGRVERAIRYVRGSFFAAREWRDLDDLNRQAREWCQGWAMNRPWPEDRSLTVREAFAEDSGHLLALPEADYPLEEQGTVKAGKTPYVRFDGNDYSIPHDKTRRTLAIRATEKVIRIIEGTTVIAEHERSWSKGEQIEDQEHLSRLGEQKRRARCHRGYDRLQHAAPATKEMLRILADRGESLGVATKKLLSLLDQYGSQNLEEAVKEALSQGSVHPATVDLILDKKRRAQHKPPSIQVHLPDNPMVRELSVKPHDLESYDRIGDVDQEVADGER